MPQIKTSLPDDLLQAVDEVAAQTASTPSAVIRAAVAFYFGYQNAEPGTIRWHGRKVPRTIKVLVGGEDDQE